MTPSFNHPYFPMTRIALGAFLALLIAPAGSAQPLADHLRMLDGSFSPREHEAATRLTGDEHTALFVRQDGPFLAVTVQAGEALDVASLCVATSEEVQVLHASAALGRVIYTSNGDTWTTSDAFAWALRDPDMTEAALQTRRSYLNQHGWVATTMQMGTPGEVEFLLRRDALPSGDLYLAAGLMPRATPDAIIGLPGAASGACANRDLVAGSPPSDLHFQPVAWTPLPDRP